MIQEELILLQNIQYEMLKDIVKVCNNHDITYYLAYGTLLGAVRHKGVIPWDYDIDIFMDAKNLEKFSRFSIELNEAYYLDIVGESSFNGLSRVYKKNTLLYTESHGKEGAFPIHVDILKLEYAKSYNHFLSKIVNALSKYLAIAKLSQYEKEWLYEIYSKSKIKKAIIKSSELLRKIFGTAKLERWIHNMLVSDHATKNYILVQKNRKRYPVRYFGTGRTMLYKTQEFNVPVETKKLLKMFYGDYMKFPPEKERFTASMGAMKIQF